MANWGVLMIVAGVLFMVAASVASSNVLTLA